jgi:DNA-binding transcriptional MerR regulator
MFKIGDFSKLSRVPVSALRYYDEVGLLKPVRVDGWTSYRYYSAAQLPRLNRILALKDLGFSLEEIARLLDEDLPPAQIRGMLRLRQAELQSAVREEQARLVRVETRLRQIEMEGKMPSYEIVLKSVEPQIVASARGRVEGRQLSRFAGAMAAEGDLVQAIGDVCGRLGPEVENLLERTGARSAGPWFLMVDQRGDDVELEMAAPVERSSLGKGRLDSQAPVGVRELPGARQMASAVHQGSYETILQAYSALGAWIEKNGYQIAGPCREVYVHHAETGNPPAHVTEVQFPVEKA